MGGSYLLAQLDPGLFFLDGQCIIKVELANIHAIFFNN